VAVTEIELKKRLGSATEVSFMLPLLSYNSGFMDGFLEAYHDITGTGNYGRERRPDDELAFFLSRDGEILIEGESGELALGDIRLGAKRALNGNISAYGFVDLPTGNPDKGYGNGSIDWGAALLVEGGFCDGFEAYLNAGFVMPGDYKGMDDFELEDYLYGGLGAGWTGWDRLSVKTQLMAKGSPFRTGIRELDTEAVVWSMGGEYLMGDSSYLELSFSEDINTAGAPDFMLGMQYRRLFR
jgi:hypothetical protein